MRSKFTKIKNMQINAYTSVGLSLGIVVLTLLGVSFVFSSNGYVCQSPNSPIEDSSKVDKTNIK